MKNILANWNLRRILYLVGGIFFAMVAFKDQNWWMIPVGIYFMAMAIFRFGCASGNCEIPLSKKDTEAQN
ncbi:MULTISPECIES: hypothetical protein [Chryseobacterium]|uniref:hypothetical protein n=1 Tax=Chryseobacterium sp. R2A-55 TaxID=2744445 RepID=UPI001F15A27D|nr:hypothetical protein [Chryseobacterium sp. R2A-55]